MSSLRPAWNRPSQENAFQLQPGSIPPPTQRPHIQVGQCWITTSHCFGLLSPPLQGELAIAAMRFNTERKRVQPIAVKLTFFAALGLGFFLASINKYVLLTGLNSMANHYISKPDGRQPPTFHLMIQLGHEHFTLAGALQCQRRSLDFARSAPPNRAGNSDDVHAKDTRDVVTSRSWQCQAYRSPTIQENKSNTPRFASFHFPI